MNSTVKGIVRDTLLLFIITLIAGLALGFVYQITKEPIAKQQEKTKQEAYQAVFTNASSFEAVVMGDGAGMEVPAENGYTQQEINECMVARDSNGEELGYVMTVTTKEGYGGDIVFSLGIQKDGTVNGIQILSISETAGLGMKAKEDAFKGQFAGKKVEAFAYTKTGAASDNEIDAISGATITTNAMTNGVNAGICFFQYLEGGN